MSPLPLAYGTLDPGKVDERLAYASFVSQDHRLLYVETPKVCSTTMKWVLAALSGAEVSPQLAPEESDLAGCIHYRDVHPLPALTDLTEQAAREALRSPDWLRICIVRDPYARLVSAWADKIRLAEPGHGQYCRLALEHAGRAGDEDGPTFREFARWVVETNDPARCDGHWQRQTDVIMSGLIDYNVVMRAETLAGDLAMLLDRIEPGWGRKAVGLLERHSYNVGLPVRWSETYDEALAAQVAAFYEPDFRAFGYDVDGWRSLVGRPDPDAAAFEAAAIEAVRSRNAVIEAWNQGSCTAYVEPEANWSRQSLLNASERWLKRRFSSASSSAKVLLKPFGTNTGS